MDSPSPLPLFDSMSQHKALAFPTEATAYNPHDVRHAHNFLSAYTGSQGTFNAYRREVERLLHWSALVNHTELSQLTRNDIEQYIQFCQQPPRSWIGTHKPARFITKLGQRIANPAWRPFTATVTKAQHRQGITPSAKDYQFNQASIRELFAILSSFFQFLIQEEYLSHNPVALIRQKSKYLRGRQGPAKIRRLSEPQWRAVIDTATRLANQDPEQHERTLFIMSALYSLYLRISELAASDRWTPSMNDFASDAENRWWFTTVGKGNKERRIAVSDDMLNALKRWRHYLGFSAVPSPADHTPLLPKQRGQGPIGSTNSIRLIVQHCFDCTIDSLRDQGLREESETLVDATVHWLRHTGISDDVKIRPREHVRDDAGHSSGAITDRYIDVELAKRHQSARTKTIQVDSDNTKE